MTNDEYFAEKVHEQQVPVYRQTKGEIWNYFLTKNEGDERKAASEAARVLSGESKGKAYRNARRNFEERRGQLIGKREATPKWRQFGRDLPPIGRTKPPGGYRFHVVVDLAFSPGKCGNIREFDVMLNQDEPTIDDAIASYFEGDYDNPVEEICSITVS